MEEEAPSPDKHVANKSDQEYPVMAMFPTAYDAFDSQVHEEEVGHCIDNLGCILCRVIILKLVNPEASLHRFHPPTSSHQFNVEVTGPQYPFCGGGYATEGSHGGIDAFVELPVVRKIGNTTKMTSESHFVTPLFEYQDW